jgi:hypothetical protein
MPESFHCIVAVTGTGVCVSGNGDLGKESPGAL